MPYRNGLIQAAVGALFAATFLISNSISGQVSRQKRVIGIIQKVKQNEVLVKEPNGREHRLVISEKTGIHLNDRAIPFAEIENGRRGCVVYEKKRRTLLAIQVELFPTHHDFNTETSQSQSV